MEHNTCQCNKKSTLHLQDNLSLKIGKQNLKKGIKRVMGIDAVLFLSENKATLREREREKEKKPDLGKLGTTRILVLMPWRRGSWCV